MAPFFCRFGSRGGKTQLWHRYRPGCLDRITPGATSTTERCRLSERNDCGTRPCAKPMALARLVPPDLPAPSSADRDPVQGLARWDFDNRMDNPSSPETGAPDRPQYKRGPTAENQARPRRRRTSNETTAKGSISSAIRIRWLWSWLQQPVS
jgi:hypothetical protein